MFSINVKADKVTFDAKAKKSVQEPVANVFRIESFDDVKALTTPELIEVFNGIARAEPELKINETARFSSREIGEKRVWGILVGLKNEALRDEPEEEETPKKRKVKKAKEPRAPKAPKEKKARAKKDGPKTFVNVIIKKQAKVHPLREGSAQALALSLVSRKGGISVDDWIEEMNKVRKRGKWRYGNAWSGLVYLLSTVHGYGLRRENNRFYLED